METVGWLKSIRKLRECQPRLAENVSLKGSLADYTKTVETVGWLKSEVDKVTERMSASKAENVSLSSSLAECTKGIGNSRQAAVD